MIAVAGLQPLHLNQLLRRFTVALRTLTVLKDCAAQAASLGFGRAVLPVAFAIAGASAAAAADVWAGHCLRPVLGSSRTSLIGADMVKLASGT